MKNILIIILFIPIIGFSQKCNYKVNEIDEFTGDKVVATKPIFFSKAFYSSVKVSSQSVNDVKALNFELTSTSIFTVNSGSKLLLMTDKDEVITLLFSDTIISSSQYQPVTKLTYWTVSHPFILSNSDFDKLVSENIKKIRWYTTEGYIQNEVKKKKQKVIADILKCISI